MVQEFLQENVIAKEVQLIVLVYVVEQLIMMNVIFVMMILQMIVFRTVMEYGVEQLLKLSLIHI